MIMVGADSQKRTHTFVAVDEVCRYLAEKTVRTNTEGHLEMLRWSRGLAEAAPATGAAPVEVRFALEDCRHLTRRLEGDLLTGGGRVVRVPTRLMAEVRKVGREPGKSDPIDARAVALAALRHPELPVAEPLLRSPRLGPCREHEAARRIDAKQNRLFLEPVLLGGHPDDVLADAEFEDWFEVRSGDLEVVSAPIDFPGVNYYIRHTVAGPEDGHFRDATMVSAHPRQ